MKKYFNPFFLGSLFVLSRAGCADETNYMNLVRWQIAFLSLFFLDEMIRKFSKVPNAIIEKP